ncbi:Dual specificity protein phosphatase 23 [Planktothrix tepida]|uniref:Protein phosphatase-like protein n=1 Tax=Planktothrix tepida PCC 9214 TaxID=671072 RepID=A0A1J1LE45_9CYAN|nr:cyclin-dependent kinase inhibitor 3 family protein [Planktothrix tepida]CAD5919463.1 Dual specificity protein phosphatase 23 [Planktothrix tepida]CUR30855.1 Protein phosphatase-like protein [Planktothrix tepida PCC 9214]
MNYARTSNNFPINVDFLPPDVIPFTGKIGMTYAPGKSHQGMHVLWDRSLYHDLDRLRYFYHTDVLVSLIEPHEFHKVQIPTLFPEAEARGMETIWFPIPDLKVPTSMQGVINLVPQILNRAKAGKTVVVHCMGGFGRTGTIVSCCLVTLGYTPENAIAIVRHTREYCVETSEQEEYVSLFSQAWNQLSVETCHGASVPVISYQ